MKKSLLAFAAICLAATLATAVQAQPDPPSTARANVAAAQPVTQYGSYSLAVYEMPALGLSACDASKKAPSKPSKAPGKMPPSKKCIESANSADNPYLLVKGKSGKAKKGKVVKT